MAATYVPFSHDFNEEMTRAIRASSQEHAGRLEEEMTRAIRASYQEHAGRLEEEIKIRQQEIAKDHSVQLVRQITEREKWDDFIAVHSAELEGCHDIYRSECYNARENLFNNRFTTIEASHEYIRDLNLSREERENIKEELYLLYRVKRSELECMVAWGHRMRNAGETFPYY